MAKIDTSGWKKFPMSDLGFLNYHGERLNKAARIEGDIPFITAGFDNQGVAQYIGNDRSTYMDPITVDMFGNCFFHKGKCAGDDNVYFFVSDGISELRKMFIASCIHAKTSKLFAYAEQFRQTQADALDVALPVDTSGEPDWAYMDEYMSGVMEEAKASLENMGKVEKELHSADISGWKRFTIGSLFEIEKGTRLTRAAMIDGDTPFIGATLENNGITARVGNTGHVHPGGLMTVAYNGQKATGKAFYQPIPFWASDDVNVLYPKFSLTENIALFLAPLFWEAGRPYSFGDKWGKDAMENDCLVLPVNASSDPDWAYMDEYMRDVMEHAQSDLSTMQSIG